MLKSLVAESKSVENKTVVLIINSASEIIFSMDIFYQDIEPIDIAKGIGHLNAQQRNDFFGLGVVCNIIVN